MLELKGICWTLPGGEEILKDINLTVPERKLTVITGPNGGGKTSLAKLVQDWSRTTSGKILLDGEDITDWDITRESAEQGPAMRFSSQSDLRL